MFAVGKFHSYLYGRRFMIESDHQPLSYISCNSKAISPTASSINKRWALTLSGYSYTTKHKPGKNLGNANALSRLPRKVTTDSDCIPGDLVHLHVLNHLSTTTISSEHTSNDGQTLIQPSQESANTFYKAGQPHNN